MMESRRPVHECYPSHADLGVVWKDGERKPLRTLEDWALRRTHIIEGIEAVMGPFPGEAKRTPLEAAFEPEEDAGGYRRIRVTFASEPGDRIAAWLLKPKGAGPFPAMLCLHQTVPPGKDEPVGLSGKPSMHYAHELAQRGYVCLAPDYLTMGENHADPYALGYESGSMKGIWNHVRSVDLLESLDAVDAGRIGCIGHSLGGHNTLYLGVFEPRLRLFVSSCGFNSFAHYKGGDLTGWTSPRYMPRIESVYRKDPARMPFDFHEVIAALAPRPVFVNAPLGDGNFLTGVAECIDAARAIYALYDAADALAIVQPEAEHDFPGPVREQVYAWIEENMREK